MGFQPDKILCVLCNHSGGAFQRTNAENGTWAHCLCAIWIPELMEKVDNNIDLGPVTCVDRMDKARKTLKCTACNGRSGSVQCAHARCMAAIHPHCALKEPSDFSWRVIECTTKEGTVAYIRELFCARHADDVGLPTKHSNEVLIHVRIYIYTHQRVY